MTNKIVRNAQDIQDEHELYSLVSSLPASDQLRVRHMVNDMHEVIKQAPEHGHLALGLLVLQLTGLSVTDIK